jgi:glycosyltransferase involved in cell wall biosynthesis
MTSLSVVIPARNEATNIGRVLDDLNTTIASLPGHTFDVIVVDDGSTDDTARIAESRGARVIRNRTRKHGKGVALRMGFEAATGDLIAMMDADYSHRAEELPRFLDAMQDSSVGLVIGSRVIGGSEEYTHIRALGNVLRDVRPVHGPLPLRRPQWLQGVPPLDLPGVPVHRGELRDGDRNHRQHIANGLSHRRGAEPRACARWW